MKQYVLEDTPSPAAAPVEPVDPVEVAAWARRRGRWRVLLVLAVVEPVVLALLYVALVGVPSLADDKVQPKSARVAPAAPLPMALAAAADPQPAGAKSNAATPGPETAAAPAEPPTGAESASRITLERGRFVIELHGVDVGSALAMLSKATHATVSGSDIVLGQGQRIHRSLVAASPAQAWQAVFGDLGNFAIACTAQSCDVHFVAAARGTGVPATPDTSAQAAADAAAAGVAAAQAAALALGKPPGPAEDPNSTEN